MPNRLSIGLTLASRGVLYGLITARQLVEMAEIADRSGAFDRVWVGDSLIGIPRLESITLLAAAAGRTKRVNLGVACMASTALRDPVLLAIQWASLDLLAEGRTTFVACSGRGVSPNKAAETRYYGIESPKQLYGRMVEGMELLRRLWSEDRVTFEGEYFKLKDVSIGIRPAQKPKIPIWLASDTPAESGLRRVAKRADGWMGAAMTPEEFAARWQRILQYGAEYGRKPEEYSNVLYYNMHITDKREEAYAESKRFLSKYYGGAEWSDEALKNRLACGTPQECAALLQQWRNTGLQNMTLRLTSWDQFGQLKRLIEEVLPRV